jgi:predicted lipoprotein with Yx(FWY)xxD motif
MPASSDAERRTDMRVELGFGKHLGIAGCVLAASLAFGGSARAEQGAVKVSKNAKVGSFLTDEKGMTLYVFKKDTPGKSVCAGPCVDAWPLFYAEKVTASGGAKSEDFSSITRDDGKKQTTYKGMPLYYFVKDEKPGDVTGHGVKEVWIVATP